MDFVPLLTSLLTDAKPGEFAQNLLLFAIAWGMMKKTIKTHFISIEEKAERMALSLVRLEDSLSQVKSNHGERILRLEQQSPDQSA